MSIVGDDAVLRSCCVTLQGLVEHALLDVDSDYYVLAIFHTPAPPTPFCLGKENPEALMHTSIAKNVASKSKVLLRQKTILALLRQGIDVVNIFPRLGRNQRTKVQLENYEKIKSEFFEQIFDIKLDKDLNESQVGATYLICTPKGERYVFAIRASQANFPKQVNDEWCMVIGNLNEGNVQSFYKNTMDYLLDVTAGEINGFVRKIFSDDT